MGAVKSRRQPRGSALRQRVSPLDRKQATVSASQNITCGCGDCSQQLCLSLQKKCESRTNHSSVVRSSSDQTKRSQLSDQFLYNKYVTVADSARSSKHSAVAAENDASNGEERLRSSHSDTSVKQSPLFRSMNLDTHPAVTRLQNEQNQRLEGMEQRMRKIRKSAQQEAERRKFAHLFKARTEDKLQTDKLLKEASVALQQFKKEKQMKRLSEQNSLLSCDGSVPVDYRLSGSVCPDGQETDKGDIIPVHIVSKESAAVDRLKQPATRDEQPLMWLLQPIEQFHLNGFVLWLVLPFLLPVLLMLHLIRQLTPNSDNHNSKKS